MTPNGSICTQLTPLLASFPSSFSALPSPLLPLYLIRRTVPILLPPSLPLSLPLHLLTFLLPSLSSSFPPFLQNMLGKKRVTRVKKLSRVIVLSAIQSCYVCYLHVNLAFQATARKEVEERGTEGERDWAAGCCTTPLSSHVR